MTTLDHKPVILASPVENDDDDKNGDKPEEIAEDSYNADTVNPQEGNPPRKRSKVSRACDSCRRKKTRCNAEYSSSLQKVTKLCNNCIKNDENCTFSRTPLKRGPSKGYIRDLEEKLDSSKSKDYPPQQYNTSLYPLHHQPLPFPPQNHLKPVPPSANASPIILPPLVGYASKLPSKIVSNSSVSASTTTIPNSVLTPTTNSNPSSPRSSAITGLLNTENPNFKNASPPIQGPFWKVPYEMPASSSRKTSISNVNPIPNTARRRSSIDSVSSTSTTGSRLPSLKRSVSINSDIVSNSDSEDFYSVKSNVSSSASLALPMGHQRSASANIRQSQSSSPRNSVLSLLSLNGRINKNLHIQTNSTSIVPSPVQSTALPQFSSCYQNQVPPYAQHYQQPHHYPQYMPPQYPPQYPQYNPQAPPQQYQYKTTPLETNLNHYYSTFHPCFPILPFNPAHIIALVGNTNRNDDSRDIHIVELFNLALQNLINYKETPINAKIHLLSNFLSIYPFNNFDIELNDTILIFYFSGLVLLNYAILLNGDIYSLGISATMAIYNDFKVLENFNDLVHEIERSPSKSFIDFDNIKLYLPKLYFCLSIIDNMYALSFGVQKAINNELVKFLNSNVGYLMPSENFVHGINIKPEIFRNSSVFSNLVLARDQTFMGTPVIDVALNPTSNDFSYHFLKLIYEKFELKKYLIEINQFFAMDSTDDDLNESLLDYNFKLIRIVKRFSNIIINFANYISTSTTSSPGNSEISLDKSPNSSPAKPEPINPLLNISIAQLFRATKTNKLIIDSLITFFHAHQANNGTDLMSRCLKINNDLSISFNLLNLNLVHLQLGSVAANMTRKKLLAYKFNFDVQHLTNGGVDPKNAFHLWRNEIQNIIIPFINKENVEGWL